MLTHLHPSRRWLFGSVALFAMVIVFLVYTRETAAPTAHGGTPPPAQVTLTPEEHAYYAYIGPRLHELVGRTQILARLGSEQSHNIFVLEKTYNRTMELITQMQQYEQTHGIPPRFQPAHDEMTIGIAMITKTMGQAEGDFFHFQWDKLQPLLATFNTGNQHLVRAAARLDQAGGGDLSAGGTPIASPSLQQTVQPGTITPR